MRIIIIEDTVYKCSEKVYKEIKHKEESLSKERDYGWEIEMDDYLISIKDKLKYLGMVDYDFRL